MTDDFDYYHFLLNSTAEEWNEWRSPHPESKINLINKILQGHNFINYNLSKAYLWDADLRGTNLSDADLCYADLRGANLSKAVLYYANLSGANLSFADLRDADLSGANLDGADLSFADLRDADLSGANLAVANLTGANLTNTKLYKSDLTNADLSGADLSGAELINTNLVGACLANTNLNNTVILLLIKALSSSDISAQNNAQEIILKMGLTHLIPTLTEKYSQEINNIKGCLILLKSYPKENKNAIFGLALKIDLGLLKTRNLIKSVPVLLPVLFILKEGEKYQKSFEELGAIVTLVSC